LGGLPGPVPAELCPAVGQRVFGCDACQEVCPWNRRAPTSPEPAFAPLPGHNPLDLAEILALDEAAFRRRFPGTPLWRAGRESLMRNAALALSNSREVRTH
jgi:epoxyqueuosine reductase